uniref:Capsid protein n=1 Tax=viral metagenome TaxID=1070528 RepID=A0A6M3KLH4_9ZZZZ
MVDETTKDQQGNTSDGKGGSTSSEQETPTLTIAQAKALADKARSDALAEVGRLQKAAEQANNIAQGAIRRLREREEEDLRREEEAARGDPERLSTFRSKQAALRAKAEAEEERRKLEEDKSDIQTQRQEVIEHRADRLSEKYNVEPSLLLKYGGTTKESMEELAKSFGERTTPAGDTTEQHYGRMTGPPDSGKTKGSGGLTVQQAGKMSPEEVNKNYKELAKLPLA